MRTRLVVANWKMNGSFALLDEMLSILEPLMDKTASEVVLCPPDVLLSSMKSAVEGTQIAVGAQNVHSEVSGAFTGETSAGLLQECGVQWCIVGHSERRNLFAETDEFIRSKTETLLKHGIRPILCIGESLEQREAGKHEEVVIAQLGKGLAGLAVDDQNRCVVAYEPIWAIGTGKTATPEEANSMHKIIRKELESLASPEVAEKMQILYGGSVNAENAETLLSQSEIDGALVGGASLKTAAFPQIVVAGS
ncbi:MAG: triose-phosphate isomerase [SAR324 cluster bacterium]|nr:triose-phosphate isomerase [SAR324 cluster bacterium]MBL7035039.1 triose-phosphate isomerase [SAR324 cluster bacterium]